MKPIKIHEQPKILNDLLDGINQASGACSQLLHAKSDPRFAIIREALNLTHHAVTSVATFNAMQIKPVGK